MAGSLAVGMVSCLLARALTGWRGGVVKPLMRLEAGLQAEARGIERQEKSQWAEARAEYREALAVYREADEAEHVSKTARRFAWCCVKLGRFGEARQLYEEVTRLCAKLEDLAGQADALTHLAEVYMHTRGPGGRQEALRCLGKAKALYQAAQMRRSEASMWGNMGLVYQSLYQLSLLLPDPSWWRRCHVADHAPALRLGPGAGWLDCALQCHWKALELIKPFAAGGDDHVALMERANQLGCIAETLRQKGDPRQALLYYEQQKEIWDTTRRVIPQDLGGYGLCLLAAYHTGGDGPRHPRVARALKLIEEGVKAARRRDDEMGLILAHSQRAQAMRRTGQLDAARLDLQEAVAILERIRPASGSALSRSILMHSNLDLYGDLIEVLIELDSQKPGSWSSLAFEYCERAKCRVLLDMYISASQYHEVIVPEGARGPRMNTALSARTDIELGKSEDKLDQLAGTWKRSQEEASGSPETELDSYDLPDDLRPAEMFSYEQLAAQCIGERTLVLEMFSRNRRPSRAEPRDALLVVIPATSRVVGNPVVYRGEEAEQLMGDASSLRQHAGSARHPDDPAQPVAHPFGTPLKWVEAGGTRVLRPTYSAVFDPAASGARRLHAKIMEAEPVRAVLNPPGNGPAISHVVFVPHGDHLSAVPYCALHDGHEFLVERYTVATSPSLQWQMHSRCLHPTQANHESRYLGLASATPELQQAAAKLFAATGVGGMDRFEGASSAGRPDPAREALFSPEANRYTRVILLAHGEPFPNPGLHLGARNAEGRFLAAGDVLVRDVYSRVKLNCDLLALLVCFAHQQGLSLGGEWQSLTAAFIARGARSVLAGPWALHIDSTERLLHDVFRGLDDGLPPATALQRAQAKFAKDRRYKHPYYWALSLIGHSN